MTQLTIRPKPLPDELCSSWLIRLAAGQGLSLREFNKLVSPRIRMPNQDSDLALGTHHLQPIADATGIDIEHVRATLLRFDPAYDQGGPSLKHWIMPIGEGQSTDRTVGYQYCPTCLASGIPYFRKNWRFALFTSCTDHKCFLVDSCARCGEAIHSYSSGLAGMGDLIVAPGGLSPLSRCGSCGWDLRNTPSVDAPDDLISQQKGHEAAIASWRNQESDPSDYFWALLHASATFARELADLPYQVATVGERKEILLRAMWLLEDGRWRYIQSVCSMPRPAVAQWKPRSTNFEEGAN